MSSFSARLPKWFGERPGKKAGDPDTPEGSYRIRLSHILINIYWNYFRQLGEEDAKAEDADVDEDAEEVEEVEEVEEGKVWLSFNFIKTCNCFLKFI